METRKFVVEQIQPPLFMRVRDCLTGKSMTVMYPSDLKVGDFLYLVRKGRLLYRVQDPVPELSWKECGF